jgi:hypothetical protein
MVTSRQRGHKIIYQNNQWIYGNTKESNSLNYPCVRCGKAPTKEGYDACLGYIPGARSACCGHGVSFPILVMENLENVVL